MALPEGTFSDLDWRDKPQSSPPTGALIQSRVGKIGDFHAVLPWNRGGLCHWERDNVKQPELPWHPGTLFGDATYVGAAVAETDYTSHHPEKVKNLDVVAVTTHGRVEFWTRECGGDYRWSLLHEFTPDDAIGPPSLSYGGSCFKARIVFFDREAHAAGGVLIAYPSRTAGIKLWWCINRRDRREWHEIKEYYDSGNRSTPHPSLAFRDARTCVGVSSALYVPALGGGSSWKKACKQRETIKPIGPALIAAVFDDGGISVFDAHIGEADISIGKEVKVLQQPAGPDGVFYPLPARGSPCAFQSDYMLHDRLGFASNQPGDLVVMAPGRNGGILFWLKNFGDQNDDIAITDGWNFQYMIGTELYDGVSCIQSNFGPDTGNLEITAWSRRISGFHQYWADWEGNWGGPLHIDEVGSGTVRQGLEVAPSPLPVPAPPPPTTVNSDLEALAALNIDYSVDGDELLSWLADPVYTPYPSLLEALIALIRPGRLRRPVYIDVIRWWYEDGRHNPSPRAFDDINMDELRAAVLAASNRRYNETLLDYAMLIEQT